MADINRDLWMAVKPLLDEVLELSPDAQGAWLERLAARDQVLADEVRAYLAADPDPSLEWPSPADRPSLAGQAIGKYTLERPIGHGGMGTVWLARRSDGRFESQVAIKFLNLALVGRAGEERFAQEGRVLARLTHPNIARLIDSGVTNGGQPYLVLEYVVGQPIDQYLDRRAASVEERIEVCLAVAAAVASAHANLIIHRDIKPSNVLVTLDGQVKLLDFGIAKLLAEGRPTTEPTTLTEVGGRALTPEYAAPELILGEPVSTATDVYSLAVLLCLLLTGRRPHRTEGMNPADLLQAVLDHEPLRLSVLAAAADREMAAKRASTPARLRRLYRGDLDNILATALKRQPGERYPTVAAFADDLSRYLRHEPVAARPDSWGYRTGKFIRRHRTGVLAAVVASLSLIGGTGFAIRQMRIAERQRDTAELARRRTNASVGFESLLFRLIGPEGGPITYQELLNRGRAALEKQYRTDPVAAIQLASQFAYNYSRTGQLDTSKAILTKAFRTADSIGDRGLIATLRCRIAYIDAQTRHRDSASAAIALARIELRSVPAENEEPLEACDLAEAYLDMASARGDEAIPLLRTIAARSVAHGDTLGQDYLETLNELAYAMIFARRTREALAVYQRLIERSRNGQIADPEMFSAVVYNAATTLGRLGEFREQLAVLRRELGGAEPTDSVAPPGVALLAYGYGGAFYQLQRFDSAAFWYRRALDHAADLDPDYLALALGRLEMMARQAGQSGAARNYHLRAATLDPATLVSGESQIIRALAAIQAEGMDSTAALAIIRARLDSLNYRPNAPWETLIEPLLAASDLLTRLGAFETAAHYAAEVVRITTLDSLTTTRSGFVGVALVAQARALLGRGDVAKARDLITRALPPLAAAFGPDHPVTVAAAAFRDSIGR